MTDASTPSGPDPDPPELPPEDEGSAPGEPLATKAPTGRLAAWPPPGLERMQGDLWSVIDGLGIGGAIFTTPLLVVLTLSTDPWRTGIFGDAWWIVVFTSVLGIWILMSGYARLFRTLTRWRAAVRRGYAGRTVGLVLADRSGDTGFILQGARAHSLIPVEERRSLLAGRLVQAGLGVAAGLWMSAGFTLGVVLSARGVLDEVGLAIWTLAPTVLVGVAILGVRAWETGKIREARKAWHEESWADELTRAEIHLWHGRVADRTGAVPVAPGDPEAGGTALRGVAVGVAGMAVAVFVLAVPLVTMSGVGPIVALVATPHFSNAAMRVARTEPLVPMRLSPDPAITPLEAGEALHSMVASASGGIGEHTKEPPRRYEPVLGGNELSDNPTGIPAHLWARELMPLAAGGLEPAVVEYLEELGTHPALAELGALARAEALDEVAAFYRLPFAGAMTAWEMPVPKYGGFNALVYAQVGAAAADVALGRTEAAEMRLREVMSAGVLMARDGHTLLTSLIGVHVSGVGAEAMANLYEITGRQGEAGDLRESLQVAERAAELGATSRGSKQLADMPRIVTDTGALRSLRWEHFQTLTGVGPCLNLNRVVFGPPEDHEAWLERARQALVRFPSDQELFDLMLRGWGAEPDANLVSRLFGQVMGSGVGSCAALVEAAGI